MQETINNNGSDNSHFKEKNNTFVNSNQSEIAEIEFEITKAESEIKRKKTRSYNRLYLYIPMCIFVATVPYFVPFSALLNPSLPPSYLDQINTLIRGILAPYSLVTLGMLFYSGQLGIERSQRELDLLRARKKTLDKLSGISPQPSYFDSLVQINIVNLGDYYTLVRAQTDKSFLASIMAGGIGFLLIITGLIVGVSNITNTLYISYITTGAGIITEFIASVFFYLYNKTVLQMKGYHDSLLAVQNILLSFKIVEDIPNDSEKIQMVSQMLKYLLSKEIPQNFSGMK